MLDSQFNDRLLSNMVVLVHCIQARALDLGQGRVASSK